MATPWNRAADRYVTEWMPRFRPYHLDLVRELALDEGQRVLVTTSGPGAEVLALAHAVGPTGLVLAHDGRMSERRLRGRLDHAQNYTTAI